MLVAQKKSWAALHHSLACPMTWYNTATRKVRSYTEESRPMSTLQDVEQILSQLSRAEKAQVLQWIVRDLADAFPGIDNTPDVLGGEARIVRTRIPVWVLVQARRLG